MPSRRKSIKALIFLTLRGTVNGIKRALTSPQRLIGLLVVLLYYFQFMFRAMISPRGLGNVESPAQFDIPPLEVVGGFVFGLLAALNLILMFGALTPRGGFRPPDVDVLFATPMNPKLVLLFRMFRDYLITLLFPFLIALLTGRGAAVGLQFIFRNVPEESAYLGWAILLAWFLLALSWVCLGYGLSLFVNRSDDQSDLNKKIINSIIYGSILSAVAFTAYSLKVDFTWETALSLAQNPFLRTVFFGATFASWIVMGAVGGNLLLSLAGVVSLTAVSGVGIWMAFSQVQYMYDQAAAKGFDSTNLRKLQQSGDQYGLMAEQARRGKVKTGKIAGRVSQIRARGATALLWKELILQARSAMFQYYIFGPMVLLLVLVPIYGSTSRSEAVAQSWMLLGFLALGAFMITMNNATSGFIELLRRVDLQKPLPFTPAVTVFFETVAKAVPTILITLLAVTAAVIIDARLISMGAACLVIIPTLALVLTSVILLVTILFPDFDDATQRSFRGLMFLLGVAIASSPGGVVMVLIYGVFHLNPMIAALPIAVLNLAITVGLTSVSGALYAKFNPSE